MRMTSGIVGSRSILAVLLGLCACAGADAGLMTVVFEGPITSNTLPAGNPFLYDGPVLMRLSITYESTAPDVYPGLDTQRSIYRGISSVNISVLGPLGIPLYSASGDGASARFLITDEDPLEELGVVTYIDQLSFLDSSPATSEHGTLTGPDIMGLPFWMVSLGAVDEHNGGGPLSSDALPTSFTPADWDHFAMSFIWHVDAGPNVCILSNQLTATTTVVPVPGALLLGCLGMAMAGWLERRRRLR